MAEEEMTQLSLAELMAIAAGAITDRRRCGRLKIIDFASN